MLFSPDKDGNDDDGPGKKDKKDDDDHPSPPNQGRPHQTPPEDDPLASDKAGRPGPNPDKPPGTGEVVRAVAAIVFH